MLLSRTDGTNIRPPTKRGGDLVGYQQAMQAWQDQIGTQGTALEQQGYVKCYSSTCGFYISPQAFERIKTEGRGYATCPVCHQSYHYLDSPMPWFGPQPGGLGWDQAYEEAGRHQRDYKGGITINGLSVSVLGDIGENLISDQGVLPGYGKVTWWHPGGAASGAPLDGATKDWGIEVKTISYDARNHRFIAGGDRQRENGEVYDERTAKMDEAVRMGKQGVLGLLVLVDFRHSLADVYAREMPVERGRAFNFRSGDSGAQHLLEVIPFKNPWMDPNDPTPISTPIEPPDDMPF